MEEKIIFSIIDGLGDEPIKEFSGLTPLEKAKTPFFDFLAREGITGTVEVFKRKGKEPTSEDSHLAIFGYNPLKFSPGRGVLEALGLNLKLDQKDVCLRGNFATLNNEGLVVDRRAGRIKETQDLISAISGIEIERVKFLVYKGLDHRVVLVLRGENLSPQITDGDDKKINVLPPKIKPKDKSKEALFTAKVLNKFLEKSRKILENHPLNKERIEKGFPPANYLLLRGAGRLRKAPSFKEKYNLLAFCIAGAPLYKGIARYLGMEVVELKEIKGLPDDNLNLQVQKALELIEKDFSFAFLHFKAGDNLAEDGKFEGKKEYLEKVDLALSQIPKEKLGNFVILITGDHATCSLRKSHCSLDVPILISGTPFKDRVSRFGESFCKEGILGRIYQTEIMSFLFHFLNQKYGKKQS